MPQREQLLLSAGGRVGIIMCMDEERERRDGDAELLSPMRTNGGHRGSAKTINVGGTTSEVHGTGGSRI